MHQKNILLFYLDEGGHKSLAEATKEAMYSLYPDYKITIFAPRFPSFMTEPYRYFSSDFQEGWGIIYKATDQAQISKMFTRLFYLFTRKQLREIIKKEKPDIIGTNASVLSSATLQLAKKAKIPTFLMVADPYTIHKTWLVNHAFSAFIAPTSQVHDLLVKAHINPGAVSVIGWPIRQQFQQSYNREETAKKYSLDPSLFTIFIGGSVNGGVHVSEFIELLKHTVREPIQLINVCGRNQSLFEEVSHITASPNLIVKNLGYVQTIAELIAFSDCVAGKAGPNALFESLTLEKPFIVLDKLPGQEDGNSDFIIKHQVGLVCTSMEEGVRHVLDLQHSKDLLQRYQENIRRAKKYFTFSPEKLAHAICSL